MLALAAIPQIAGGTVPVAARRAFPPVDVNLGPSPQTGRRKVAAAEVLITDAGSHVTFVATLEGSHNGIDWFNLAQAVKGPNTGGLTLDENGIAFAAAVGTPGFMLELQAAFKHYRLGLAGDNAAADGAGKIVIHAALT